MLRHAMPDGGEHLDWMIERPDAGRGLISFRLAVGTDLTNPEIVDAERISDHRREYLVYEGPISGDRGRVERVAEFRVVSLAESEVGLRVVLEEIGGGGRRMEWIGERQVGPRWRFSGVVC